MSSFDLSTLNTRDRSETGSTLTLRHPVTGDVLLHGSAEAQKPVTITLLGVESSVAEKMQREAQRRRLKKGFQYKVTPEELEAEALNLLGALTQSWDGVGLGVESLECNAINAQRLYREMPWIRKQVDEFVNDIGNYLGN